MKIYELLRSGKVSIGLKAKNKEDVLGKTLQFVAPFISSSLFEVVQSAVLERESIMSTGVGKGLAIPHAKVAGLDKNHAVFVILKHAIEYQAIDGEPVDMLFLIIGPQDRSSEHIKLLSRISRLMNSDEFRKTLKACTSSEEVVDAFKYEEERYFNS